MASTLEQFLKQPTLEELDKFKKADLVQIAENLQILFDKSMKKAELKSTIVNWLVEHGSLQQPEASADVHVEQAEHEPAVPVTTSGVAHTPKLEGQTSPTRVVGEPAEAADRRDQPFTLPRFEPLSPTSTPESRKAAARHRLRIERLKMEAAEKERNAHMELQLRIKQLEIEAETKVKLGLKRLELEAQGRLPVCPAPAADALSSTAQVCALDVSKYVSLFPIFRESEVDSYFPAFERIALALKCPREVWATLLQCKVHGKAQEVAAALSLEENRKRKTRVCHINMLKLYHARKTEQQSPSAPPPCASALIVANPISSAHDIDVKDAKPIRQHPYRVNPAKRALMKQEAEYLLENGLAKHSSSAWSSPCLVEDRSLGPVLVST
ncbi:hypothetical protein WMY93_030261 [Mugilogobius chulae]|uniref:Uncharacterized protein n=1 Tax=Mugilogobius chulae TaxID=88201 RepID=A0AAW0MM65_9GOBI